MSECKIISFLFLQFAEMNFLFQLNMSSARNRKRANRVDGRGISGRGGSKIDVLPESKRLDCIEELMRDLRLGISKRELWREAKSDQEAGHTYVQFEIGQIPVERQLQENVAFKRFSPTAELERRIAERKREIDMLSAELEIWLKMRPTIAALEDEQE